mmetsp:Transcript_42393/g.105539  ORF Transcript_42393/g.105539 Transcript_42393/m.105539 type:complete len:200 (+) Transcript_42393:305-904(+)
MGTQRRRQARPERPSECRRGPQQALPHATRHHHSLGHRLDRLHGVRDGAWRGALPDRSSDQRLRERRRPVLHGPRLRQHHRHPRRPRHHEGVRASRRPLRLLCLRYCRHVRRRLAFGAEELRPLVVHVQHLLHRCTPSLYDHIGAADARLPHLRARPQGRGNACIRSAFDPTSTAKLHHAAPAQPLHGPDAHGLHCPHI